MSTHDLGIVYENEFAEVREFETETKPYGCHSEYKVTAKHIASVPRWFNEQKHHDAKQRAIDHCDSYVRQVVS